MIRQLRRAVTGMLPSTFNFCYVHGKAGVGKTVLCRAALQDYLLDKCSVLFGRFDEPRFARPYSGLDSAFQHLPAHYGADAAALWGERIVDAVGQYSAVLTQAFPSLGPILQLEGGPPPPDLPAAQRYGRFVLALTDLFAAFSDHEAPVVLILDDAQWLDRDSAKLLTELALSDVHMLVVLVYRDEVCGPECDELQHRGAVEHEAAQLVLSMKRILPHECCPAAIHVPLFSEMDVAAMLQDVLRAPAVQMEEHCQGLLATTQGRPLFLRHLLQHYYEEGAFSFNLDQDYWQSNADGMAQLPVLPDMARFFDQRMRSFPAEAQDLLGTAAWVGRQVSLSQLVPLSLPQALVGKLPCSGFST